MPKLCSASLGNVNIIEGLCPIFPVSLPRCLKFKMPSATSSGPAWSRLKKALISKALLVHPGYGKDFLLDCDGPGDGLGAVLLQPHEDGKMVIAYASPSLLEHEKK